jgi:hypothetical protein
VLVVSAAAPKTKSRIDFEADIKLLLQTVGFVYLLRVPLLLFAAAALITAGGLIPGFPGSSLLRGVFDVALATERLPNLFRFLFLTFTALAFATTLGMTTWTTVTCAHARFGSIRIADTGGTRLACVFPPVLLSLVIVIGCAWQSPERLIAFAGCGLGFPAFAGFLWLSRALQRPTKLVRLKTRLGILAETKAIRPLLELLIIIAVVLEAVLDNIPGDRNGYVSKAGKPLERHRLAASLALASLIAYAVMWYIKTRSFGSYPIFPTLALLLLLGILTGWVFSGITFFLDRYRVPVVIPFALYAAFTSSFPQSDHYYNALSRKIENTPFPPQKVIASKSGPTIVVAATGGGIQAAAWTARVLRQLQAKAQDQKVDFESSVRLISAVSGGSVGTMYFVNAYMPPSGEPCGSQVSTIESDCVIRASEASSLDEVTSALVYEDLTLNLLPFVKGISFDPPRLVSGPGILNDRGNALENAFKRVHGVDAPLLRWKKDAIDGHRPAVIFNATMVETGERLLLSTTDLDDQGVCKGLNMDGYMQLLAQARDKGRVDFHRLYCISDVSVATAVRLSATFPVVSPAARILEDDVHWPADHVVDGGYADNYGVTSLVEWLDEGLKAPGFSGDVMVIEIRAGAAGVAEPPGHEKGFLFETLHPATTLLHVRDTGQYSHDQLELSLLKQRYDKHVCSAVFQYVPPLDRGLARPEPLSWHLTTSDKNDLRDAWAKQGDATGRVMQYLGSGKCQN